MIKINKFLMSAVLALGLTSFSVGAEDTTSATVEAEVISSLSCV